jgi:hypothetical protein
MLSHAEYECLVTWRTLQGKRILIFQFFHPNYGAFALNRLASVAPAKALRVYHLCWSGPERLRPHFAIQALERARGKRLFEPGLFSQQILKIIASGNGT